ncbi:mechanosensitive ion channel family protein [Caenispirillum salinarum]|uniref:mechanosensitive ion channel family protein n=1 Tax=Caenispirillum salinarum TaxID=859058 RepID=UPI00384AD654
MSWLPETLLSPDVMESLLLVVAVFLVTTLSVRFVRRRTRAAPHVQRRWTANLKNAAWFLLLVGLMLIWAPQLQALALSLTAVAVAIVVATKELILCFSGSFMRTSSRAFSVGDWVEVGAVRGEVVDHNIFATTLQEIDGSHYTGRTVVMPNSAFLTSPVRNMNLLRSFAFHSFNITVDPAFNLFREEAAVRAVVERHVAPFAADAAKANAQIERRSGVDIQEPTVRLRFSTTDLGKYRATVTVFVPTAEAEAIEAAATREIMEALHERISQAREAKEAAGKADAPAVPASSSAAS